MFVITGPPGSGKTSLLHHLVGLGFVGVPEPAREVIAQQRAIDGDGVYDRNPALFNGLMLARAIADFELAVPAKTHVFFDRGIPDLIGYAELAGLDTSAAEQAASVHRYDPVVFVLPSWAEIYVTDADRRMSFTAAEAFGARVAEIYKGLGYTLVEVSRDTISARATLVSDVVRELTNRGTSGSPRAPDPGCRIPDDVRHAERESVDGLVGEDPPRAD